MDIEQAERFSLCVRNLQFALVLILLFAGLCPVQAQTGGVVSYLHGDGIAKEWVQIRWSNILSGGEEQECKQGKLWIFHADRKLEIKECVDKRTQVFSGRWVLTRSDNEHSLKIELPGGSATKYAAVFKQKPSEVEGDPPIQYLILRTPRTDPAIEIAELTLTFQDF